MIGKKWRSLGYSRASPDPVQAGLGRVTLVCLSFLTTPRWEVSVANLETFSEIKQPTQKGVFATHSEKCFCNTLRKAFVPSKDSSLQQGLENERKSGERRKGRADQACNRKMES